jgi:thiol-disulfide isomerase/thioredoxin
MDWKEMKVNNGLKLRKWGMISVAILMICVFLSYKYETQASHELPGSNSVSVLDDPKVTTVKPSDIEKLKDDEFLVYFFSESCNACHSFTKKLAEYQQQGGSLRVYAVNVDVVMEKKILEKYYIKGTPTIVQFKNGLEVWRMEGDLPITNIPKKSM